MSLYMQEPPRPPRKSFILDSDRGDCTVCFRKLLRGERVRFDEDGFLHHIAHKKSVVEYKVCDTCFLTLPCEC